MWAVDWVALCPWVRAIFAQALLSLFAGRSLNPSCQDWLNWAAAQLGCFLSNKQNHVVWRYLRAEKGWKILKQTGLDQREIRKHVEVHTEIAPRTRAPSYQACTSCFCCGMRPYGLQNAKVWKYCGQARRLRWTEREGGAREPFVVPFLISQGSMSVGWVPPLIRERSIWAKGIAAVP